MNKGKDICLAAMMMELDQPEHDINCDNTSPTGYTICIVKYSNDHNSIRFQS